MNNLKDIHNQLKNKELIYLLFYQDFNEQFEGYTQPGALLEERGLLFYQDFNEQFEGYTQLCLK